LPKFAAPSWDITSDSLYEISDFHGGEDKSRCFLSCAVVGYQSFDDPYYLHFQGEFPEDGGNKALRNVGILPQNHTATQPGRSRLETSKFCR